MTFYEVSLVGVRGGGGGGGGGGVIFEGLGVQMTPRCPADQDYGHQIAVSTCLDELYVQLSNIRVPAISR